MDKYYFNICEKYVGSLIADIYESKQDINKCKVVKEMIDMQNRVNFDIWYIENWTYWLDLQIIFQTIINLIKGDEKAF